jgi:3'(2'), 5'-bisphosphate nucleotidase
MTKDPIVEEKNETLLLRTAIRAALEAGNGIMDVEREGDFNTSYKSDDSPLTQADRVSHDIISSILALTGIPVLSEEGKDTPYAERALWSRLWIVDPLDGTKEFLKRNGEYTVNIALVENSRPVFGVIFAPMTGTLYFGGLEYGGWKVEDAHRSIAAHHDFDAMLAASVRMDAPANRLERPIIVASRSHMNEDTTAFIDSIKNKHGDVDFVSKGSSLKLCLVAEGVADIYPRMAPTMEWDIAAGDAIASAAGCLLIDHATGAPLRYNKEALVNPHFVLYGNGYRP